jgi:hypothetical protein
MVLGVALLVAVIFFAVSARSAEWGADCRHGLIGKWFYEGEHADRIGKVLYEDEDKKD